MPPTSRPLSFDLAGVQTGAPRQADLLAMVFKRQRASHRSAGPSKVARIPSSAVFD
jgi:hypothetical protein